MRFARQAQPDLRLLADFDRLFFRHYQSRWPFVYQDDGCRAAVCKLAGSSGAGPRNFLIGIVFATTNEAFASFLTANGFAAI
jgi:hypothetical protein